MDDIEPPCTLRPPPGAPAVGAPPSLEPVEREAEPVVAVDRRPCWRKVVDALVSLFLAV